LALSCTFDVRHITAHLHHPEPAIWIEGENDRILNEWLGGH
jgi:hypothetical protein